MKTTTQIPTEAVPMTTLRITPRIIKKTRTVMECLHRFCRECIDKSMRLGNNECPACRKHCASRRSLRDDQRFDNLTEVLYEDIEKYEEEVEELAFHEEEKSRNKQIQASIAQVLHRQSEALVTKRKTGKERHSSSRLARAYSRRRHSRGTEHEGSEDDEENNPDENKDSSSTDERGAEIKQRRCRRRAGGQLSQPSPSTANTEGGGIENDLEATKESKGTTSGPIWNPEMLAWGGAGARKKSVRNTRIMKLAKYLENLKENDDKVDVHLALVSLDKQRMPSLQKLYLCCPPQFSVEHLKEYVARETQVRTEDIEILLMKNLSCNGLQSTLDTSNSMENKDVVQVLEGEDTLAVIRANCASNGNHLILAYRLKEKVHHETTPEC
ncbi:putative E3 ubiquitin-protein ligase RING1a isoform X4 [Rhododendron vialii]|uniref:putative E3 ubiquitin-protein ligase RING1a isoform X4 n=1 Tax=Rhododendron vialii TaxID=182163 RepID=UPI00265E9285|nr:putative E3 ubiquitin-protein ligase RING1a isoform X4 [Rhododendron vialii]XP_058209759.1 putative E3 ubiquitin-protein ligase RING1a isoform X4 [Rhododendron vialii]